VWPILHYDDTRGALRYLADVSGFRVAVAVEDEDGTVVHVELRWPGGGVLVFGSTKHTESVHGHLKAGSNAVYVVTDDVDDVHARVFEAAGDVIEAPHETDFGSGVRSRVFTARDPEGNMWTFGTYRGPP
jgi:uncharacterized glyoxalase superfamily protein PhnB